MAEAVLTVAEAAFMAVVAEAITAGAMVAEAMAAKAAENRAADLMVKCVAECDPVPAAAHVAAQARVDAI